MKIGELILVLGMCAIEVMILMLLFNWYYGTPYNVGLQGKEYIQQVIRPNCENGDKYYAICDAKDGRWVVEACNMCKNFENENDFGCICGNARVMLGSIQYVRA